jgi:cell division inhibitor SepF
MEDYDDEYYDDHASARPGYGRQRFGDDGYGRYESRFEGRDYADPRGESSDYVPGSYRGGYGDEHRFRPHDYDRNELTRPRLGSLRGATRGALAMDPRRMAMLFDESSPLSKITTLRPKDYSEARTIGERFRDGTPVIMDLVSMDNADAKRLVDFAAGLAFALRGSFDKVATKVFLLSPADVDVSPEERRRIAETGFYAYQ